MPAPKGHKGYGHRPKGSRNKKTLLAVEAVKLLVDKNADKMLGWLDLIAKDNPLAAFNCYMSVLEYSLPKLARTEITGKDGERFTVNVAGLESVPMRNVIDAEFKAVEPVAIEDKTNG